MVECVNGSWWKSTIRTAEFSRQTLAPSLPCSVWRGWMQGTCSASISMRQMDADAVRPQRSMDTRWRPQRSKLVCSREEKDPSVGIDIENEIKRSKEKEPRVVFNTIYTTYFFVSVDRVAEWLCYVWQLAKSCEFLMHFYVARAFFLYEFFMLMFSVLINTYRHSRRARKRESER